MSLRLTAIALRPTRRGPASASRKQLPSSSMSVVAIQPAPLDQSSSAASSPGPINTRPAAGVRPTQPVDERKFAARLFRGHD